MENFFRDVYNKIVEAAREGMFPDPECAGRRIFCAVDTARMFVDYVQGFDPDQIGQVYYDEFVEGLFLG